MVSFLPHLQNCFRFVYIYIKMIFHETCQITIHASIFYQHNEVMEIVSIYCEWFVDNKLSIILVKMKLNAFFYVGRKTSRS